MTKISHLVVKQVKSDLAAKLSTSYNKRKGNPPRIAPTAKNGLRWSAPPAAEELEPEELAAEAEPEPEAALDAALEALPETPELPEPEAFADSLALPELARDDEAAEPEALDFADASDVAEEESAAVVLTLPVLLATESARLLAEAKRFESTLKPRNAPNAVLIPLAE